MAQISTRSKHIWIALLGLGIAVAVIYGSHLNSEFHLDDMHTTVQNPWIRDLGNLPKFFTDGETSGVLAANRVYRPILTASLAIDYWLGGGLKPVFFHLSNLFWFSVTLVVFFVFCRHIFQKFRAGEASDWTALFATALYGVHPAMAETVSYVIQRSEIYSTLGVLGGVAVYALAPRQRRYYLYLIPPVLGMLSKPPALVFPAMLFLYIWLIEEEKPLNAAARSIPATAVAAAMAILTSSMMPHTYTTGATSTYRYLITQPAVALRFFQTFFVPATLTADTDRAAFPNIFQFEAIAGLVFVLALTGIAVWTARRWETKPISFGIFWFLIAQLPNALFPMSEVENDHRMFFPFLGMSMAVCWTAGMWLWRRQVPRTVLIPVCGAILAGYAFGAWQRCDVWRTEESLWHDVTIKSPRNGRGLMNYGLALMVRGDYTDALAYFLRALPLNPNYNYLETNLGIVYAALNNNREAERHFVRAISLDPKDSQTKYFYARWLQQNARADAAILLLRTAIRENPSFADGYYLLMQLYASQADENDLHDVARQMLALFPTDTAAAGWLKGGTDLRATPEVYLEKSLALYNAHDYMGSIAAAQKALQLRPSYAEAWNNIGAAYNSMRKWDEGIHAEQEALRINPHFELAKNNLAWAQSQKNGHK